MEETAEETEAWALVAEADGMLKVTPWAAQRPVAALMVFSRSAGEQAAWTHGVREAMKAVALQTQAMSVGAHPVLPKLEIAQVRAHGGS